MIRLSHRAQVLVLFLAATVLAVASARSVQAQSNRSISGPPNVIAGDLLKVGDTLVRLYAIDAPEINQTCERKGKEYPCGTVSIAGLKDLTAGLTLVTCYPNGKTSEGIVVARCEDPQKFDLSQQMVYTGWALALPDAANLFHDIQAKAQKAKRGLWKGHVTPPWRWRMKQTPVPK